MLCCLVSIDLWVSSYLENLWLFIYTSYCSVLIDQMLHTSWLFPIVKGNFYFISLVFFQEFLHRAQWSCLVLYLSSTLCFYNLTLSPWQVSHNISRMFQFIIPLIYIEGNFFSELPSSFSEALTNLLFKTSH